MALNQVGARTEGDVYQGLFFWRQAADLLRPGSMVAKVVLEHDEACSVDDVAVFYRDPGVNAGGWMATADYYQLKYHVDNRNSYTSDAIIDPSFINANTSLLQRFHVSYNKLVQEQGGFRLHLASNWRWKDDDKLAALIREYDGKLPSQFFEAGPRAGLGKIREEWQSHLELDSDAFERFARTLRFQLDHFGRREFKAYVYATLEAAGLRIPSADHAACPYESLIQQFLMNGPNSFTPETFRDLCMREGLLFEAVPSRPKPISIGVRSYIRFAERLESQVDAIVCTSKQFEGRHPIAIESWQTSSLQVLDFFSDPDRRAQLRTEESEIMLECHGSLALLTGWELSRNSGAQAAPIQKPNMEVWRPTGTATSCRKWQVERFPRKDDVDDVAVCLSVTRNIYADVNEYLSSNGAPPVCQIVQLTPEGGASAQSIHGSDHAYQLACDLPDILASVRRNRSVQAHIFFACPNALMFFIGQQREALGRLALYEFDFGMERHGSYQHSFSLPITASPNDSANEVCNDS